MKILITKHFSKWAKKNLLSHDILKKAALEIFEGNIGSSLGHHLFKKRIGIQGQGKRSAARAIVFYQVNNKLIYVHGYHEKR